LLPDPSLSTTLMAGGQRVRVLDTGGAGLDPGATTLLCLHGWGGTACDFLRLAEALRFEMRIVAIDLPGTGGSEPSGDGTYPMSLFHRVIDDVRERLGIGRYALVGHSMGGKVSVTYLLQTPDPPEKLVLIAPYGFPGEEGPLAAWLARHPHLVRLGSRLNSEEHLRFFARHQVFHDPRRIDPRSFECVLRSQLSEQGREALSVVTLEHLGKDSLEPLLPEVRMPTLLLWGKEDRVLRSRWAQEFHRLIPGSRLVLLPECGHQPMVEKAEETAALIREFLDD
jgi:pimeloyl-ACP methyl ester carboxylesterase